MSREPHSPNEYDEERIAGLTDFRCEKCRGRYPIRLLADVRSQLGHRLCLPNCAQFPTKNAADIERAQADVIAAGLYASTQREAQRQLAMAPVWSELTDMSFLTDITTTGHSYPDPIRVGVNASVTATLVGTNFQSTDVITTNSPLTVTTTYTPPTNGDVSISITVTTTVSATRGDYDLLFNGMIWRRAIAVR